MALSAFPAIQIPSAVSPWALLSLPLLAVAAVLLDKARRLEQAPPEIIPVPVIEPVVVEYEQTRLDGINHLRTSDFISADQFETLKAFCDVTKDEETYLNALYDAVNVTVASERKKALKEGSDHNFIAAKILLLTAQLERIDTARSH